MEDNKYRVWADREITKITSNNPAVTAKIANEEWFEWADSVVDSAYEEIHMFTPKGQ